MRLGGFSDGNELTLFVDGTLLTETGEGVKAHDDFCLFATQNPAGGGYGGRKQLSRAFRSRFLELHVEEVPDVELFHYHAMIVCFHAHTQPGPLVRGR
jgi:midasin (ATPase involved in ribosome maturation)